MEEIIEINLKSRNNTFYQFTSEEVHQSLGGGTTIQYNLLHAPILMGSVIFDVSVANEQVESMFAQLDGNNFNSQNHSHIASASIDYSTGVVTVEWLTDPGFHVLIFEYHFQGE